MFSALKNSLSLRVGIVSVLSLKKDHDVIRYLSDSIMTVEREVEKPVADPSPRSRIEDSHFKFENKTVVFVSADAGMTKLPSFINS
jgi:hypothetical protein